MATIILFIGWNISQQRSKIDFNPFCLLDIAKEKCQDGLGSSGFVKRFDLDSNGAFITCEDVPFSRRISTDLNINDYPECLKW